ncbi:hypothetical protein BY996DRAFT_6538172 [Phakopsora pachyrhizi]|nr:hypothetical protein BY996DRAFT_6538172 [Phakopsora pachyrhizi]
MPYTLLIQHSQHHLTGIQPHKVDVPKEAQRQSRQDQPPDPEVPKVTRPTEEPMTPGLDGRQAADANIFTYSYDLG